MKRTTRNTLVTLAAALFVAGGGALWAGMAGKFTCRNAACNFKEDVSFGGGFRFEQITGYCVQCQKFVYLTWPRGKQADGTKAAPPQPLGRIWDAASAKTRDIYKCPHCSGPFQPVLQEELKHCPKCGNDGTIENRLMFD